MDEYLKRLSQDTGLKINIGDEVGWMEEGGDAESGPTGLELAGGKVEKILPNGELIVEGESRPIKKRWLVEVNGERL